MPSLVVGAAIMPPVILSIMFTRLSIAVLLSGCSARSGSDTSDTSTVTSSATIPSGYTGPTALDSIRPPGCNKAEDSWVYQATTLGWTDCHTIVNAWETGNPDGWNEEHTMPSDNFGPLNSFDVVRRTLAPGAANVNFMGDFNTVFACGVHDTQPVMTYAIRIYDMHREYVDCAIFSTHGQEGIDMVFSGRAPARNPVSKASEINSTHCTIWNL